MITVYTTLTGSIYEVDQDNKRVRRLNDKKGESERAGFDGQWKEFVEAYVSGGHLVILWPNSVLLKPEPGVSPCTITSPIVKRRARATDLEGAL